MSLGVLALVLAVTVSWGFSWPAMKVAVSEIPPFTFRLISVLGAGAILLAVARISGEPMRLERRLWPAIAWVSLFNITGWHMLTAYGLLYVEGGRAAIMGYTMPVWAALLGVLLLKERLTARRIAALLFGMAAMGILIGPDLLRVGAAPLGAVIMIVAAMSWATGLVGVKMYEWRIGSVALSGWQLLVGSIPILLLWPVVDGVPDLSQVSRTAWLALVYVVLIALVFSFTAHVRLVRILPVTVAALCTLAIPVVGVVSSAALLGERVGWDEVAALALVLCALTLVLTPGRALVR
jgi:drug/metabolite transporter (DMT)-like permease